MDVENATGQLAIENARLWTILESFVKDNLEQRDPPHVDQHHQEVLENGQCFILKDVFQSLQQEHRELKARYALMKQQVYEYKRANKAWQAKTLDLRRKLHDAKATIRELDHIRTYNAQQNAAVRRESLSRDPSIPSTIQLNIALPHGSKSLLQPEGLYQGCDSEAQFSGIVTENMAIPSPTLTQTPQGLTVPNLGPFQGQSDTGDSRIRVSRSWPPSTSEMNDHVSTAPKQDRRATIHRVNQNGVLSGSKTSSDALPTPRGKEPNWSQSTTLSNPDLDERKYQRQIKREPSSSPVAIVSSRSLKRKSRAGDEPEGISTVTTAGTGSICKPLVVKEEPSDESGSGLGSALHTNTESLDLDDIGHSSGIPRKRRRLGRSASGRASSLPVEIHSQPLTMLSEETLQPCHASFDETRRYKHESSEDELPQNLRMNSSSDRLSASRKKMDKRIILGPLDPNEVASECNSRTKSLSGKASVHRAYAGVKRLDQAARHQHHTRSDRESSMDLGGKGTEPAASGRGTRVGSMLEGQVDERTVLVPKPVMQVNAAWDAQAAARPQTRRTSARMPAAAIQSKARLAADTARAEIEPMRSRPEHLLNAEDFVVNRGHGTSHASDEATRNRARRKCMPGCTKPNCCGKQFRDLVRIGGLLEERRAPRQLRWSEHEEQGSEEESTRLARVYLGLSKGELDAMSEQERGERLIEAKAGEMAQLQGRHREDASRADTPPGFWDTEMPETQVQQQHREQARRQERAMIAERRKEAVREGGRWKFRDEH